MKPFTNRGISSSTNGASHQTAKEAPHASSFSKEIIGQIYWSKDGVFSDRQSHALPLAVGTTTTQRFTIAAGSGPLHLRFDPSSSPGSIEIFSVIVRGSTASDTLLCLRNPADWENLKLGPHMVKLADTESLKLLNLDDDPQVVLPILAVGEGIGTIEVEVCLCVCPGMHRSTGLKDVAEQLRQPHTDRLEEMFGPSAITAKRLFAMEEALNQCAEKDSKARFWDRIVGFFSRKIQRARDRQSKTKTFQSNIDTPSRRGGAPRIGCIKGWVFASSGAACLAVRARIGRRIWIGEYFIHRPDIPASYPGAGDFSGFAIPYELPSLGTHRIVVEVFTSERRWKKFARLKLTPAATPDNERVEYSEWLEKSEAIRKTEAALVDGPRISVLLPVHNPPEAWLRSAIDSVLGQTYRNWELCIANDASTLPFVRRVLDHYASRDSRIRVLHRTTNGKVSAALNSALELASGEFITFLDHDDELALHALGEVARTVARNPDANIIYSDEDFVDGDGTRCRPHFKPDFSPDLLLGRNFFSHLAVYRSSLLRQLGGHRVGYEGSQDWDLALRATEQISPETIVHIPQILYHWRAISGSAASHFGGKDYSIDAARRLLTDHLERTGQNAELLLVPPGRWRVRHILPPDPPSVSLIIPTRNCVTLLRTCVESLLGKTTYPNLEIVIVDNSSDDRETLAYFNELQHRGVKIVRENGPFNFSAINNNAVKHAKGEILGFLNNDIEVISPDWLGEMVSHAIRPGVAAVGPMLYYPGDRVQHAGVVLGIAGPHATCGVAGHVLKGVHRGADEFMTHLQVVRNYSAVTGACLVVRREIFEELGGFNEADVAVAYNDIDFCLRARAAGYRNVWTPFAELYHHESASRGFDDTPEKIARFEREFSYMREKWGAVLDDDPAYNPNLTLMREDLGLAWPPRPILPGRRGERFSSAEVTGCNGHSDAGRPSVTHP